jgi:hypothetical protein
MTNQTDRESKPNRRQRPTRLSNTAAALVVAIFTIAIGCSTQSTTPEKSCDPLTDPKCVGSRWSGGVSVSPMDDSASLRASLPAVAAVGVDNRTPDLTVICEKGDTRIWINTTTQLRDSEKDVLPVRVRFDESDPVSEQWKSATDSRSLFAPEPTVFGSKLLTAETVRIEYNVDSQRTPIVAEFDVRRFEPFLRALVGQQNWFDRGTWEADRVLAKPGDKVRSKPRETLMPCPWLK